MIEVLWPDRRWVDEGKVVVWAQDAYMDEADSYVCTVHGESRHGDCCDSLDVAPVYMNGLERPVDIDAAMEFLGELGLITFGRRR